MKASSINVPEPNVTWVKPVRFQQRITRWGKGAFTGVVAGSLSLGLQMLLFQFVGLGTFWEPVRLSASIAMGSRAVAVTEPFTFNIFFVGLLVHYVVSIWYATLLGMLIRKLRVNPALLVGAVFGLALYFAHFYGLAWRYPWVTEFRQWITIVGHVAFGLTAAWVYSRLHVKQLMRHAGTPIGPE